MTETEQASGTYVYGVVRAGTSLDPVEQADGDLAPVRLVEVDDLAALVSDSPERATRELVLSLLRTR